MPASQARLHRTGRSFALRRAGRRHARRPKASRREGRRCKAAGQRHSRPCGPQVTPERQEGAHAVASSTPIAKVR
eukprot:15462122-Alexandrium_andersonii.AAC.1